MAVLVIVCGLMGSGKSTIAREISKKTGIEILSSDLIRKRLVGISPSEHKYEAFGKGIYSPEFFKRTYLTMVEEARKKLKKGKSIILDATFSKLWQRETARKAANKENADFLCIEITCPDHVIKARMEKRVDEGKSVSDGRWELFPKHKANYEKIDELNKKEHMLLDTNKNWRNEIEKIVKTLCH